MSGDLRGDPRITLEGLFTSPAAFGVTTATPLQRAICRVADGRPLGELATDPVVLEAMGDVRHLEGIQPREMYVVAASRAGKSRMAAALGLRAALTVDLTGLTEGDEPRIPILSIDKDKASAIYTHMANALKLKPSLRPFLVREGRDELNSLALWIRHPSGRVVQVSCAANKAAGNAVVSFFLVGCIIDEFPRMNGADTSVVNFDDVRHNALGRLLPGAQLIGIGSPWAPFGPAYQLVTEREGKPTAAVVVVRAKGRHLNPLWWTAERIASLPPEVARVEEGAQFKEPEEALFSPDLLRAAMREGSASLPWQSGHDYVAAMDPATRNNAWTLVVCTLDTRGRLVVAHAQQWVPVKGTRLDSRIVLAEVAAVLGRYRTNLVYTDPWAADPLADHADNVGVIMAELRWDGADGEVQAYDALRLASEEGRLELPPDEVLREDLAKVRKVPTQKSVSIKLPVTKDGRHCDYAPSLARAASLFIKPPPSPEEQPAAEERLARYYGDEDDDDEREEDWRERGNVTTDRAMRWGR